MIDVHDPGDVIRVRMLTNWCSSHDLCELFNRMTTDGNYEWRFRDLEGAAHRLRITAADDDPDYWVVINAPPPGERVRLDAGRTVVFQMEPLMWSKPMRAQWGSWAAPSPLSFLQVRDHRRYRNSCDWWLGPSYPELRHGPAPQKQRVMAACVSSKRFDPGHVRRLDFLGLLDRQDIDLDIYGAPENGFRRWRASTPLHDKRRALLPYRYYFDAENNSTPNFYTEKIVDCLLAETLCFYWGCPNLDSFLDPRAYIRLELDDFDADLVRVREAIMADEWSARLPYIRAEKRRILDQYQFFPTLARVIDPVRRRRRWWPGGAGEGSLPKLIGERRCGIFVEISDRSETFEASETLDAERRLDWSGLCLESDPARARRARRMRDCTVVDDDGRESLDSTLARNGLSPIAIDWLNLAVDRPSQLLGANGRLDPDRVRANIVSMPTAAAAERSRAAALLQRLGYQPADEADEAGAPSAMVRTGRTDIYGFYHLCTINGWREIMDEQVRGWWRSGLAQATRRIFVSIVGPAAEEGLAALTAACDGRLELVHLSEDPSCFERPVLEYARRFCEQHEPLARACWYMHAKGVTHGGQTSANVADWRRLMEYFVVGRWRQCVALLDRNDACGVNWRTEPKPHFSGNFWWATPRYLASLPSRIGPAGFDPERWIASGQPRIHCLHDSGIDHYLESYPPVRYTRQP